MTAYKQAVGETLLDSLAAVAAWKKGEAGLEIVEVDIMPPDTAAARIVRQVIDRSPDRVAAVVAGDWTD
ncbi:MAG: hypothetical protein ACOVN0_06030 [Niveispirillum sp.]|uniref:hypothetical protein n=1 Tax=Niveispirillum sp. TaxID=1917217 RepID=UPI003BA5C922